VPQLIHPFPPKKTPNHSDKSRYASRRQLIYIPLTTPGTAIAGKGGGSQILDWKGPRACSPEIYNL